MNNIKETLILALLIIVSSLVPPSTLATTYIVFRYDDFTGDEPGARSALSKRARLWKAEQAIDRYFEKYEMSYTIAIIPKPRIILAKSGSSEYRVVSLSDDLEKCQFIKQAVQAGRIEVAQHGLSHINHVHNVNPTHRHGEFRERPYEAQLQDIIEGRRILCESCEISKVATFVPPWNGWDTHTAMALKQAGFSILSARRFYYCRSIDGLTVIPFTANLFELESMVEKRQLPKDGVIVVVYHPKDIIEFDGTADCFGVARFGILLQRLSLLSNVKVSTFAQLIQSRNDLTTERFKKAVSLFTLRDFWSSLLPENLLPGAKGRSIYLSSDEYSKSLLFLRIVTTAFVIGLFVIGFIVRRFLSLILTEKWRFRVDMIATVIFLLSILKGIQIIDKGYHITAISSIPGIIMTSFFIGLILKILIRSGVTDGMK